MGRFQENSDGTGKSPQIQHLRPWHRSMARSVALGAQSPSQLADAYGFTPGQISRIMGSPVFQAEVARLSRELDIVSMDVAKDLQIMGERALQNLDEDLNIVPTSMDQRKLRNSTSIEVLGMLGISKSSNSPAIVNNILNISSGSEHKEVEKMSEQQLREDIMELTEDGKGTYA